MTEPTDEEMLGELQRLEEELDETPSINDMNEFGEYASHQYQHRFGTWNDAVREAGLTPNQARKIPTDELLNEITRLARKLGQTPTKNEMDELGEYYGRSYRLRFGSWNEAVQQAGLEPNQRIPEPEFRDQPDLCPLCNSCPTDGLDFHHWRYGENKAGCYLCRNCHDKIHAGGARPEEDPDWLLSVIENLLRLHADQRGEIRPSAIVERYHIPSEGLVESVISRAETFQEQESDQGHSE